MSVILPHAQMCILFYRPDFKFFYIGDIFEKFGVNSMKFNILLKTMI